MFALPCPSNAEAGIILEAGLFPLIRQKSRLLTPEIFDAAAIFDIRWSHYFDYFAASLAAAAGIAFHFAAV